MVTQVPQSITAHSLIWASMLIGSAIVLHGTPAAEGVMLVLMTGATTSLLLLSAPCRRPCQEPGDDGEPRA